MSKKVIIVGAFHEIIELAEQNNLKVVGLIDNIKVGRYFNYPVLCNDDSAIDLPKYYLKIPLIVTPDKPMTRNELYIYYSRLGYFFKTLASNKASISNSAEIGSGSIIQSNTNISSEVSIGIFVKINTFCNIMHDSCIDNFTTIAPNAVILGNVKIGKYCYIGANATILPNTVICDNVIVGAGAVVTKDISKPGKYIGIPARPL